MTPEYSPTTYPVLGAAILTAIPITAYALWVDYFGRRVDELQNKEGTSERSRHGFSENQDDDTEGEFNPAEELRTVRMMGIFALVAQVILFFANTEMRTQHPLIAVAFFLTALFVQNQIQFSAEKKLRGLEATSAEQLQLISKGIIWTFISLIIHFAALFGSGALFYGIAILAGASPMTAAFAGLGGLAFGVTLGLALSFGLAPLYLRKIMPTSQLEDSDTRVFLENCFRKAGLRPPKIHVIELDHFKMNNAMVAGFIGGRGWFTPGLFLTRSILSKFDREELKAIILHEVSHMALRHLRKRLMRSLWTILSTIAAAAALLTAAHFFLPPEATALLRLGVIVAAFALPFLTARSQVRKQETEADTYAIVRLGASFTAMASAFRKLDSLNDQTATAKDSAGSLAPGGGHPATEERIIMLRQEVEKAQRMLPVVLPANVKPAEQSPKKAA